MRRAIEVLADPDSGWTEDQYGPVVRVGEVEVRLEPLLFGGRYLAVYVDGELVAGKVPVTLGTPTHNEQVSK